MIALEGGCKQFGNMEHSHPFPVFAFSHLFSASQKKGFACGFLPPYSATFIVFFAVRQFAIFVSSQHVFRATK